MGFNDEEYRSPNAGKVFKAPPPEPTEGELLEESGEYIDSGEGTDNQGNLLKSTAQGALWGLEKYGQGIDWTNDQINLRNALRMNPVNRLGSMITGQDPWGADRTPAWLNNVLDYSYKDLRDHTAGGIGNVVGAVTGSERANDIGELAGQILLPDAIDFATGGVGYLDNIGRAATKLRKVDGKMAMALVDDIFGKSRFRKPAYAAEGVTDSAYNIAKQSDEVSTVSKIEATGPGSATSVEGSAAERMSAAVEDLKKRGYLRRDGSLRQLPTVTSRARGRTGNADLVNALSNRKTWNQEGDKAIEQIVKGLTARERKLAGKWHKHHKRPLSQNSWLVQGLEGDELAKAHKYSYKRMAAGGDVLENQRIIFDKAHDATHRYMNATIGEMRSGKGKSIQGLLDPGMTPQDFLNLKTFEERKFAMSRFFDTTDAADKKTQHILDAMDSAKTKGATISISDANYILNKLDFDNFNKIDDISDIAILDDFIKDLNKLMDPEDVNSLRKINEGLNANEATWLPIASQLEPLQKIIDDGGKLSRSQKTTYKSLKKKSDLLEIEANDLLDRKTNLLPPQAVRRYESSLERAYRGSDRLTDAPGMFFE